MHILTDEDLEYISQALGIKIENCQIKRISCSWWNSIKKECMHDHPIYRKNQTGCPLGRKIND
jgi:hypothetical protein